jgi:3-methylcrotonyl-CoA carboxylase alpha subunit
VPAPLRKILVANRGEIACRIMKTARRLGIATIAVYSEADRHARHVGAADEAFCIGPAPARESYLDGGKILDAARRGNADAIHPGYGFLAENADFAGACEKAGIVFIGPSPDSIRAMGDKARAKSSMAEAGVPIVPGYFGEDQDAGRLAEAAARIGFPVLLKPSAGGGGKGMKIATDMENFAAALDSAKREAAAAFGDDRIMVEKYLSAPRHVEVQVFGDSQGTIVHLFDRDCSIQRRHQKIIEEAPAPGLPAELARAMKAAAIDAAQSVAYRGAGTVEFMVDSDFGAFYFLEMNTRLQVEHPVTEMITGLDLVAWQIRVAEGAPLPLAQDEIVATGHAIEARIYAEDPEHDFLPRTGTLARVDFPEQNSEIRIDTAIGAGDAISVHYDPLIAKLVAYGEDRPAALRRLDRALGQTRLVGVETNVGFLRRVVGQESFAKAMLDTGFIGRHEKSLFRSEAAASETAVALAVIGLLCERGAKARAQIGENAGFDFRSVDPWNARDHWRLNTSAREEIVLHDCAGRGELRAIMVTHLPGGAWQLALTDATLYRHASGLLAADGTLRADLDGHRLEAVWQRSEAEIHVGLSDGSGPCFRLRGPTAAGGSDTEISGGGLTAPMPGRIIALLVAPGAKVGANAPVLVLEAMKMEHISRAPSAGVVKAFSVGLGDQVEEGALLVTFEPDKA